MKRSASSLRHSSECIQSIALIRKILTQVIFSPHSSGHILMTRRLKTSRRLDCRVTTWLLALFIRLLQSVGNSSAYLRARGSSLDKACQTLSRSSLHHLLSKKTRLSTLPFWFLFLPQTETRGNGQIQIVCRT